MPPHLHPRSSATTTLFVSTLAASFIIVGIPHVFPCPAPRKGYLDEDRKSVQRRRRRRESDGVDVVGKIKAPRGETVTEDAEVKLRRTLKSLVESSSSPSGVSPMEIATVKGESTKTEEEDARTLFREMTEEAATMERERRKCPVPKPGGKIGQFLDFSRGGTRRRDDDER